MNLDVRENGLSQLHTVLSSCGIPYWVDSGVLLGLVRSGQLNTWEKDIDLAICVDDLAQVLTILKSFEAQGYSALVNTYKSYVYSIGLKPSGDKAGAFLDASIHVYYPVGSHLWSPQPQFFVPPPAPDILKEKRSRAGEALMRTVSKRFFSKASKSDENRSVNKKSLAYRVAYSLYRRADKQVFTSLWPISEVYKAFTWLVPANLVLPLGEMDVAGVSLPVPCRTEDYLAYRYHDWRTPTQDWYYWRDDGGIVDEEPLRLRERLLASPPKDGHQ
jgi:phosphorylcholine metabolism protein LicD